MVVDPLDRNRCRQVEAWALVRAGKLEEAQRCGRAVLSGRGRCARAATYRSYIRLTRDRAPKREAIYI